MCVKEQMELTHNNVPFPIHLLSLSFKQCITLCSACLCWPFSSKSKAELSRPLHYSRIRMAMCCIFYFFIVNKTKKCFRPSLSIS